MKRMEKAPFVPTEILVSTVMGKDGPLGILSIQTSRLDVALDRPAADAIVDAISKILSKLDSHETC